MPWFNLIFLFILKVIIHDIGIKKISGRRFFTSQFNNWSFQRGGEPVPHKQVQKDKFVLEPNHFVLASTAESIRIPHNMAAYVERRSSIGRLGL